MIEKSFTELKEVKEKELDLAQVDSSLQLLEILQKEYAPTLDVEVTRLLGWRINLADAHEEFGRIEAELKKDLTLSPVSSDSVGSLLGTELTENVAAKSGVTEFSGSNVGTPGVADLAKEKASEPDPE